MNQIHQIVKILNRSNSRFRWTESVEEIVFMKTVYQVILISIVVNSWVDNDNRSRL